MYSMFPFEPPARRSVASYSYEYRSSITVDSPTVGEVPRAVPCRKEKKYCPAEKLSKLQTAVYPSNMAPIGAKLWQKAFQTICNF